jgi:ferritin-like metal-binding protein YciE
VQLQTLRDLLVEQLRDLYSAETQLVQALPTMAAAASHDELRQAFEHHLEETREHVTRLDEIFGELGVGASGETCKGMQGLIEEGREFVTTGGGDAAVRDAALIAAAQRVEHYEISAYGTVRTLADQLELGHARDLLDQTLDEESAADKLLTKIATGGMFKAGINKRAAK